MIATLNRSSIVIFVKSVGRASHSVDLNAIDLWASFFVYFEILIMTPPYAQVGLHSRARDFPNLTV